MDVFEAMGTLRAMRHLKPDPVPDEELWKILDAAIKAPSGGNRQPWNFIVVRDPDIKRKLGEYYLDAWSQAYTGVSQAMQADPRSARNFRSAEHLAHHLGEAPVIIIADLLAENLPRARKVVVAGAGHLPNLERPEEVNAALLSFLAAVEGEAG